jgi:hypothetical protein
MRKPKRIRGYEAGKGKLEEAKIRTKKKEVEKKNKKIK